MTALRTQLEIVPLLFKVVVAFKDTVRKIRKFVFIVIDICGILFCSVIDIGARKTLCVSYWVLESIFLTKSSGGVYKPRRQNLGYF